MAKGKGGSRQNETRQPPQRGIVGGKGPAKLNVERSFNVREWQPAPFEGGMVIMKAIGRRIVRITLPQRTRSGLFEVIEWDNGERVGGRFSTPQTFHTLERAKQEGDRFVGGG